MNAAEIVERQSERGMDRPRVRSLDAWIMSSPSGAFHYLASQPAGEGLWLLVRRPLFLAAVLGCAVSLAASGTVTPRLAIPAATYWTFVPLVEVLALAIVIWSRRRQTSLPAAIDIFFAGHAPWTLYVMGLAGVLAFVPPQRGWELMTTAGIAGLVLAAVWSAWIDFHFFRWIFGATRAAAARDVAVCRVLTWTTIFVIFAVPVMSPWGIAEEIKEAVKELLRA